MCVHIKCKYIWTLTSIAVVDGPDIIDDGVYASPKSRYNTCDGGWYNISENNIRKYEDKLKETLENCHFDKILLNYEVSDIEDYSQ